MYYFRGHISGRLDSGLSQAQAKTLVYIAGGGPPANPSLQKVVGGELH
jgi:hypothetical protein